MPASAQDGAYPRPQLVRTGWFDLSGTWGFAFDDDDRGLEHGWRDDPGAFTSAIVVPFPPESPASGIGDTGFHRVLWYRRTVTADEVAASGHTDDRRLLIHFGAVDYRADVWVAGAHVASHEGGHTPFSAEVAYSAGDFEIVVRVEDDPADLAQPRGKQDWEEKPHVVWYDRTSGIWQPVWLESVPRQHVTRLSWRPSVADAEVAMGLELASPPQPGTRARVTLRLGDSVLAEHTVLLIRRDSLIHVAVDALRNGQALDEYLWSPERPTLVDAEIVIEAPGQQPDRVASYFGFRDVGEGSGRFLINGRTHVIRGVLSQGYWPESHLAAPDAGALRAEVELIKQLGFTTVRVHQKIEDPRFLYWTDRLGVLVWEEMPSAYEFSDTATARLVREWTEVVRRDGSHPSVVAWVPFNESWGVQHIATSARQQQLVRTLYHLTKALDDSRLVISNDGWEHTRSDLLTVHDYENDPARLLASYSTVEATRVSLEGIAPSGRQMLVGTAEEGASTSAKPVILSEFGGVSIEPPEPGSWGYRLVPSHDHLEQHLQALFSAAQQSEGLAGWCYTQLTDTAQETNGLTDERRVPKIPAERIRALVEGVYRGRPAEPAFGQPGVPSEVGTAAPGAGSVGP
jgi:beta-galactosidase/beta-glucuronidase